jgi:hypothetical protein
LWINPRQHHVNEIFRIWNFQYSNSQSMTYTRHKEGEDQSAMGTASLFPDCPIAWPRCVWWWPDTSWSYPDTNFVSYYTCSGYVMNTRRHIMSLSFYYTPKVCTTGSQIYVWASLIFFLKKMDWAKGKQGEKKEADSTPPGTLRSMTRRPAWLGQVQK